MVLALIESNNQKRIVSSEIGQIKQQIRKCQEYTNCIIPDIPNEHVTAKFQEELENAHTMMVSFKQLRTDEFEMLRKQEASLNREIDLITRRAKEIERKKEVTKEKEAQYKERLTRKEEINDNRQQAVQKFQNFVGKHGHCGSWNTVDHSVFVKTWKKIKGSVVSLDDDQLENESEVMDQFQQALPGRTIEDIRTHLQWYRRYFLLEHGQRTAIEKWKKDKRKRLEDYQSLQVDKEIIELEKKGKFGEKINQHAAAKRERIDKWKKERDEANERRRLQEIVMKEKAEKLRKKEMAERRKILQERNLQRQRDSDAIKRARQQEKEMEIEYKRRKGAEANAKVKDLTAQDIVSRTQKARERQEAERMKSLEEQIKETQRKQRNDQLADWDPTRVYQPTSSHQRRLMATEDPSQPKRTFILQPGGRAQASWRAGL